MSVKVLDQGTAQMKAATTATGTRTLDFYAASFSAMPDKNGDVIDPNALDEWIDAFYKAGKPLPISFAHAAVRDDLDPFAIIGHAPANPEHVWIDNYGLRVKALLDMSNEKARQVASLVDIGVLTGASVAFMAEREGARKDGATVISRMSVLEAGPCLTPANDEAVVLGIKTAALVEEIVAKDEPDESEVVPETTEVEPETTDVEPETTEAEDVEDKAAEAPVELSADERQDVIEALASAAEVKHGGAPGHLQNAHDALVRAGAKCADDAERAKNQGDDVDDALRRFRIMKSSILR